MFEFRFFTHDNWDGGFYVYDLLIHVPLEVYVQIENQIDKIKKELNLIVEKLIPTNDRIGSVCIQIG